MAVVQDNQIQMLRARIETSLKSPYALVVSSATARDGSSICAHRLADSMLVAGHRTLLIDLDHDAPSLSGLQQVTSLAFEDGVPNIDHAIVETESGLAALSLSNASLNSSASRENVAALLAHLRSVFATIVIHAAPLIDSSIATLFANECDAVILTTREGRSVRSEDHATLEVLERDGVNFLGVVTIGAKAITAFGQRRIIPKMRHSPATVDIAEKLEVPMSQRLLI